MLRPMTSRFRAALVCLPLAAVLVTGCSNSDNLAEPEMNTVAPPSTADSAADSNDDVVTEVVTKEAPADEEKDEKPAKKKSPQKCASLPKDPREQYPDGGAPGRMPAVDSGDNNYWIADIENHYDPCAPVSWIIFHGEIGSPDGPNMLAGSRADGIAFYIDGVPDEEARLFTAIEDVGLNGDEVEFSWGERTRTTADGITAHYSVTLSTTGGAIEAIDGDISEFNRLWDEPQNQYMLGTYD